MRDSRSSLQRTIRGPVALACAAWLLVQASPVRAEADQPPSLLNPNVVFDYYEPRNPEFMPLYQKLQRRQLLEELSQFLAPVHWPKKIRLILKECPAPSSDSPQLSELIFYDRTEYSLNICYQLFGFLNKLDPPAALASRQEAITGGLVSAVLYEASRAMFDTLKIPVLGSEADAADQLSGFLGLQFGNETARTVIKGTYAVWDYYRLASQSKLHPNDVAGQTSLPSQRAYNVLCIAYGDDATTFRELVDAAKLPATRAEGCADEYRRVAEVFQTTVLDKGFIDTSLMKDIKSVTWITPGDLQPEPPAP